MNHIDTQEEESEAQFNQAVWRSALYRLFSDALEYPENEDLTILRAGVLADEMKELIANIAPLLASQVSWQALVDVGEADALQLEYTRLFDSAMSGPLCPLYEGSYRDSRMGNMEELIRFYNHFGLSRAEDPNELPDHLSAELEFMHYLAFQEAHLLQHGEDVDDYQRAQRDFLLRHLNRWLAKLNEKLIANEAAPYYRELFELLEAFVGHEIALLRKRIGHGSEAQVIPATQVDDQPTKEDFDDEPLLDVTIDQGRPVNQSIF